MTHPGESFARRYRLLGRIAIGGTAEVFRAELLSERGSRPVVIKRVLPQFARDVRFRRLFLEEATVSVTLVHPNIVSVIDHGEIGETCYIAMELVDGQDLGSLLSSQRQRGGRVAAGVAALIAAQVAEALHFIHHHTSSEGTPLRIIHRDVSPQNILVSFRGDVKLTDFGIAKSAIRRETTVDGTLRGKLDYMAPEQAIAEIGVDHRADIFGLGCVLYEMVEGMPPFRGKNEIDTLDRLRHGRIRRPTGQLDAPEQLRAILDQALQNRRDNRYANAQAMAEDLRRFLQSLAPAASGAQIGEWTQAMALPHDADPRDAVDDAVRMLLGDVGQDSAPRAESPPTGTSVFASSKNSTAPLTAYATNELDLSVTDDPSSPSTQTAPLQPTGTAHPWWRQRPQMLLLAVGLAGVLGWILWVAERLVDKNPAPSVIPTAADYPQLTAAKTQAAAKPKMLRRWIRSKPSKGDVFLDGDWVGQTPLRLEITKRKHEVTVIKPGYRRWRRRLRRAAGTQAIWARLTPAVAPKKAASGRQAPPADAPATERGYLTINSMPWTRVFLDGRFVGHTPLIRLKVGAGRRQVQLKDPHGKIRRSFVAVVPAAGTSAYTFDLTE